MTQHLTHQDEELERRVAERTLELQKVNEELRKEIAERDPVQNVDRQSQQQYEALVQSIDGIVWEVDARTFKFTFVSQKAEKILGYPLDLWLNDRSFWADHIHPEDRDWAIRFCVTATEQKSDHQFEYRMIAADGRILWLKDFVTVIVMDDETVRLRGVMVDITEQKEVEEERRQLLNQLAERVKELTALHGAAHTLQEGANTPETLHQLISILLPAFQYPEHVEIRIFVGQTIAATPNFQDAPDVLRATFTTAGGQPGGIEVTYVDGGPPAGVEQFLPEERALVTTFADMLRVSCDRREAKEILRALSANVRSTLEKERTTIAREIHDELGSALTSLRWDLESLTQMFRESGGPENRRKLTKKVEGMLKLTDDTLSVVRRIASDLRPSILDDLGLIAAIEWQTQEFQARTGIECTCDCDVENLEFTQEQSTAIFRILQEALTNILRHASATKVWIKVRGEGGMFVLTIADNGRGIREPEKSGQLSLGILGMRERVHLINGDLEITGTENQGTTITVRVPVVEKRRTTHGTRKKNGRAPKLATGR